MILRLYLKFAALATIIPSPTFGGATAVSFDLGIGLTVNSEILFQIPSLVQTIFHSSITTTAVFAIVLNAILNLGDKSSYVNIISVVHSSDELSKHL